MSTISPIITSSRRRIWEIVQLNEFFKRVKLYTHFRLIEVRL